MSSPLIGKWERMGFQRNRWRCSNVCLGFEVLTFTNFQLDVLWRLRRKLNQLIQIVFVLEMVLVLQLGKIATMVVDTLLCLQLESSSSSFFTLVFRPQPPWLSSNVLRKTRSHWLLVWKESLLVCLGASLGPSCLDTSLIKPASSGWMVKIFTKVNYPFISFHILDKSDGGSCLLYDNYMFGVIICCCCIIAKFISIMFYFASIAFRNKNSSVRSKNADDKVDRCVKIADSDIIHLSKTELPIFLNPLERSWHPTTPTILNHGHN